MEPGTSEEASAWLCFVAVSDSFERGIMVCQGFTDVNRNQQSQTGFALTLVFSSAIATW